MRKSTRIANSIVSVAAILLFIFGAIFLVKVRAQVQVNFEACTHCLEPRTVTAVSAVDCSDLPLEVARLNALKFRQMTLIVKTADDSANDGENICEIVAYK